MQSLRFAVRSLMTRPSFALIVVATLALGIGANTAIFTILRALVLRNLPVADPGLEHLRAGTCVASERIVIIAVGESCRLPAPTSTMTAIAVLAGLTLSDDRPD